MRWSLRARNDAGKEGQSTNAHWRDRWSEYVLRSVLVAGVLHAAAFAIIPSWDLSHLLSPRRETVELVQIDPIISYGAPAEAGTGEAAAVPTREEIELVREESGQGSEQDRPDLAEVLGALRPRVVYPVLPESTGERESAPPLPPLILEQLAALSPQIAASVLDVAWPLIRNPTVLRRFFRNRYNPLDPGLAGSVSVAMWINERGSVEWAAVQESSGYEELDEIALDAFNEVVAFSPARSRGSAVPVSVVISVPFTVPW